MRGILAFFRSGLSGSGWGAFWLSVSVHLLVYIHASLERGSGMGFGFMSGAFVPGFFAADFEDDRDLRWCGPGASGGFAVRVFLDLRINLRV